MSKLMDFTTPTSDSKQPSMSMQEVKVTGTASMVVIGNPTVQVEMKQVTAAEAKLMAISSDTSPTAQPAHCHADCQ